VRGRPVSGSLPPSTLPPLSPQVALCLLVSVGMGAIAKGLGLTDTAGAFAAGVLLANTNYRAQIQADIFPFQVSSYNW
jgi:Kef-type K+ transport system membrane component KefB